MKHKPLNQDGYLSGQLLVAISDDKDDFFYRTVIYMAGHDETGAFGLVLNKPHDGIDFVHLLERLDMGNVLAMAIPPVMMGGPVEEGHGFVLHTADYNCDDSEQLVDGLMLNTHVEILRDIATGTPPVGYKVCLGYSGWSDGQLEQEIQNHKWLTCPAEFQLVFETPVDELWQSALKEIGVTPEIVTQPFGRA